VPEKWLTKRSAPRALGTRPRAVTAIEETRMVNKDAVSNAIWWKKERRVDIYSSWWPAGWQVMYGGLHVLNSGYSLYLTPRRSHERMARMLVASKNPEQATAGPLPK